MDPIDQKVQDTLDRALEGSPEAQKYVSKVYYLVPGQLVPAAVTHRIAVASEADPSTALTLGVVALPECAAAVDQLLALIAR